MAHRIPLRVVLTGAESTGKTTTARALAERYRTRWIPEYGRIYTEWFHEPSDRWESNEFVHIARVQNELEDTVAPLVETLLLCDTDSLLTALWHERYLGRASYEVE